MKQFTFSILFSLIFLGINAQTETTKWVYQLDDTKSEHPKTPNQIEAFSLKSMNIDRIKADEYLLSYTLKKAILSGELTIYKDEKCENPHTIEEATALMTYTFYDTINTFDPETFKALIKIQKNKIIRFPIQETVYELSQSWDFDKKTGQVEMSIDAIHVSHLEFLDTKKANDLAHKNYLFSIKMSDAQPILSAKELLQSNIIWAKEIHYQGTFQNNKIRDLLLSEDYLLDHKIVTAFYRNKEMRKKFPPRTYLYKNENVPKAYKEEFETYFLLDPDEIKNINGSIDTIITFDPETFKEEVKIVHNELKMEEIKSFVIAQDFYFDVKVNMLKSRVLAIAPVRTGYDKETKTRYRQQLIWIVYDDDFFNQE